MHGPAVVSPCRPVRQKEDENGSRSQRQAGPDHRRDAVMDDARSAVLARNWWAVALRGVAGILFGMIALLAPVAAILSLALLFAAYLLVDGVFAIVAAVRAAQHHERWGLLLAEGVLDL